MQLNINPTIKHGLNLFEAVIVWKGEITAATHASWEGAYRWLNKMANTLANEQISPKLKTPKTPSE